MVRLPFLQGHRRDADDYDEADEPRLNGSIIPEGRKARVTSWTGRVRIVDGPARKPLFSTVEIFNQVIVPIGEQGYIVNEEGDYQEVVGPEVIHIHPDGAYKPHHRHELAHYESMVVIDEDGHINIHKGSETPTVWVKDRQRVHTFNWTGSRGDTEEKSPGALRVQTLRLQDTQTYFSFPVRTRDNIVINLRLMIYYSYGEIEKLLQNNDPLGAMYNRIMATMVGFVAGLPFDQFKDNTNDQIANHPLFNTGKAVFEEDGISIEQVVVRAWEPIDREVQRVLERAATIQTQKTLDQAEHERKMQQLEFEGVELDEGQKLEDKRAKAAASEGDRDAQKLATLYNNLVGSVGEETARKVLVLKQASQADALYLTPAMLNGS